MESILENKEIVYHYDALIEENNDPVLDSPVLQEYMDKWDGDKFIDYLHISKDKSVLEIGVGTGRIAVKIVGLCKYFTGIDISSKTINRAHNHLNYDNVNLICDDFLKYSFNSKYDVIYSSLTFMHFKDKIAVFNKIADLLCDGIFVLSIDKNQEEYIEYRNRKIKIYPSTKMEIIEQIKRSNLKLITLDEVEFAWIFVCKKKMEK